MLNSKYLSLVNKICDKTEFTITRVHCTWSKHSIYGYMQISSFVCEIEPHITFTIKFHVSATIIGKWEIKLVDKIDPFYETLKEIQIGAELVLFDGK